MSRASPFTFYEFFAGGGMARAGLGTGWKCEFANDFDPLKVSAYLENNPGSESHFVAGDVWKVGPSELPGCVDLAWASSPCQDFSLAGNRAGLNGGRSSAFFGFWRLIRELRKEGRAPRSIVIENVVGLLTSHGGADFESLCRALADEGYRFGAFELDAARFVPQSRPRVFVVATSAPIPVSLEGVEPVAPHQSARVRHAYGQLDDKLKKLWVWWKLDFPPTHNKTLESCLLADEEVGWFDEAKVDHITGLLNDLHQKKLVAVRKRSVRTVGTLFRRMRREHGKNVQRAELRFDGFAGCLRTPGGGSSKQFLIVVEGGRTRMRELTGRECARLMGLEDDYKLPTRTNGALKLCGDGVVVDVVAWLRSQLLDPLAQAAREAADGSTQEPGPRARRI